VVEGTGLENRQTRKGFEGSNPSLSVGYLTVVITPLLAIIQTSTPGDCLLTGLCGLVPVERPVASGVMWLAVGLVAGGIWGLRRANSRS
jgi:hypothetical protein